MSMSKISLCKHKELRSMSIGYEIVLFIAGVGLLTFGASWLIKGSTILALLSGISPLVVGLTVVAYGTSSPEWIVSVMASYQGQSDLAVGNVVGSNIFNILFILGGSALISPLVVHNELIRRDFPIMLGVAVLSWGISLTGVIGWGSGVLFLILVVLYTIYIVRYGEGVQEDLGFELPHIKEKWKLSLYSIFFIAVGLVMLVKGSNLLVESSISIARMVGISELVIALTIVSAGTSLPEVATSFVAAWKGQQDIAIGNIVGSNIFNILCVLGSAALVSPLQISPQSIYFDFPFMCAVSLLCFHFCYNDKKITRREGIVMFSIYCAYTAYLIYR